MKPYFVSAGMVFNISKHLQEAPPEPTGTIEAVPANRELRVDMSWWTSHQWLCFSLFYILRNRSGTLVDFDWPLRWMKYLVVCSNAIIQCFSFPACVSSLHNLRIVFALNGTFRWERHPAGHPPLCSPMCSMPFPLDHWGGTLHWHSPTPGPTCFELNSKIEGTNGRM